MIRNKKQELEAKRQDVRVSYARYGFNSPEYKKQFKELHDLNMAFMAASYRKIRCLPSYVVTPYCPKKAK